MGFPYNLHDRRTLFSRNRPVYMFLFCTASYLAHLVGKSTASYLLCIESPSSPQNDASALAPRAKDRRPRPQMDSMENILRQTWRVAAHPTSHRRVVLPWAAGKVVPLSAIDRHNEHLSIKNVVLCLKVNRQSIKNGITQCPDGITFSTLLLLADDAASDSMLWNLGM